VSESGTQGLFGGLFGRGAAGVGDRDWLQAMLDTEAALARALERAGLADAGAGAAVTAAAQADEFDAAGLGQQATLTGNPVPALVRALSNGVPTGAREAVHRGATSQDIIDTALMLLARRALEVIDADLAAAAEQAAALADAHRETVMAGRTLLQQAVPVTFGLVAAGWLTALDAARRELQETMAFAHQQQVGIQIDAHGLAPRLARERGDGRARGKDTGVQDQYVEATEGSNCLIQRRRHGGVIRQIALHPEIILALVQIDDAG